MVDRRQILRDRNGAQDMKQVLAIASFFGLLALALATTAQSSAETPSGPAKPAMTDGRVVQPAKRSLDAIPLEVLGPGVARQVVHGTQSTFARWQLKSGASVPLHHHVNEQITWIVSGRAEVFSGGERYDLLAGDVMVFAPNVEHAFKILEDTVAVDIFAPARQDWIDAAAAAAEQR